MGCSKSKAAYEVPPDAPDLDRVEVFDPASQAGPAPATPPADVAPVTPVPPVPPPPMPVRGENVRSCKWGAKCNNTSRDHRQQFWHPGDADGEPAVELPPCKFGEKCRQLNDPEHCKRYSHPEAKRTFRGTLPPCKHGADCKMKDDRLHLESYSHPDMELDLSVESDQKIGSKYPFAKCVNHPGCPKRWSCWYTHGEIEAGEIEGVSTTCFFGQPPYNGGCSNATPGNKPFTFCSRACMGKAKQSPKTSMGCRRANCPCPVTINGLAGQFCSQTCELGNACTEVTHVVPMAHLVVLAKPEPGKYSPCARQGCACAAPGGSSWNGEAGHFCSRACRNGTGCTKQWHVVPEKVADAFLAEQQKALAKHKCILPGCDEPTFNGRPGEFCGMEHRREHQKQLHDKMRAEREETRRREEEAAAAARAEAKAAEEAAAIAARQANTEEEARAAAAAAAAARAAAKAREEAERRRALEAKEREKFAGLWVEAEQWARRSGFGAKKGPISGVWFNESLQSSECPARKAFDKASQAAGITDWKDGEFGWHGTKSRAAVVGISWENWSTKHRSGQVYGPGEYFSRGSTAGLHYSEGYAGGNAADLLMVAWVIGHTRGAAPTNPAENGANNGNKDRGHIVCNNPVGPNNESTGAMYCLPIAVVAFGGNTTKPDFKT